MTIQTDQARIPLPTPETMNEAQREVFDAVVNGRRGALVGPIRAALHNPELADRWQKLGEVLRFKTSFPPILRELAIVLTARRWNAELEWGIHARAGREAGLSDEILEAIRCGDVPVFDDPAMPEIYDYVCMIQNTGQVTDPVYEAVVARWGAIGVVELTALTGYYSMVAITLNAHRIPLPPDLAPSLLVDGEAPPTTLSQLPLNGRQEA